MVCEDCSWCCADCDREYTKNVEKFKNSCDEDICERCAEEYAACSACGTILSSDDSYYDDGMAEVYCEHCYIRYREEHEDGVINPYEYKPTWNHRRAENESLPRQTPYMGIEIETEAPVSRDMVEDIREVGLDQSELFIVKHDGSLDHGFKVVSHPATLAYWNNHNLACFTELAKLGYCAFKTKTCGMHVHFSRSVVTPFCLFKMLEFSALNSNFMAKASRRGDRASYSRYARVFHGRTRDLVDRAKGQKTPPECRYTAINTTYETVEFRIFQSTLLPSAIKRNLAFVTAYWQFCNTHALTELTAKRFVAWAQVSAYRYLPKPMVKPLCNWLVTLI